MKYSDKMSTQIREDTEERCFEARREEDEMIRKSIINLVIKSAQNDGMALHKWESQQMLAWLEKQKQIDILDEEERKFADNVDSYRKEIDEAYQKGYDEGVRAAKANC